MTRTDAWFRLYNSVVDNPKVQRLPGAMFKVWINLLCVASRHGGRLPPLSDIAFTLRMRPSTVEIWIKGLERQGLFDRGPGDVLTPHDWETLQYKHDLSTGRVQRFRNRCMKRDETVSETPPEQSRSEQTKTDSPQTPEGGEAREKDADAFSDAFSVDFLKFWAAYPEKVGQNAARKAWQAAAGKPDVDIVLAAVDRYVRTKPSDRAWCNPARWIREGRWNDAIGDGARTRVVPTIAGRTLDQWRWGAKLYAEKKYWPPSFGPAPGTPGCECPPVVIAEVGLAKAGPAEA